MPPKLIWASISFSIDCNSSTISVTMAGTGDLVPQPCHSCNEMNPFPGSFMWASLGGERAAELEKGLWSRVLGLASMWVFVENPRYEESEHLNVKALVVANKSMVELLRRVCHFSIWLFWTVVANKSIVFVRTVVAWCSFKINSSGDTYGF